MQKINLSNDVIQKAPAFKSDSNPQTLTTVQQPSGGSNSSAVLASLAFLASAAEAEAQTKQIQEMQDKYGYTPKVSITARIRSLFGSKQPDKMEKYQYSALSDRMQHPQMDTRTQTREAQRLLDEHRHVPKESIMTRIKNLFGFGQAA